MGKRSIQDLCKEGMPFLGGRYFGEASVVIHMMHENWESYTYYLRFFTVCP